MLINLLELLRGQSCMRLNFLYKQAATRTSLSAKLTGDLLGDADRVNNNNNNIILTLQFSLTTLLNLQSLASKRSALSSSDLNCRRTNLTIATLLAKRIKTNKDCKKSTHCQGFNSSSSLKDNIEKLIYISKVKHTYVQAYTVPYPNSKKYLSNSTRNNRNNLNIIVTNSTSREFSRVDMKSLTRLCLLIDRAKAYNISKFYKSKNIQLELGSIYVLQIVSKSDEVPTQELSSYIKIELLRDNSRKFYYLVIIVYIMSLERASLILFIT
ncbi:hypothetical protein HBI80_246080 [Parastagonospora nodorum]|nr:hypothetical protein HBI80_246080 [Parastagonospora nodorum]